jgi:tetratricopeptide (TPR) repeat protein
MLSLLAVLLLSGAVCLAAWFRGRTEELLRQGEQALAERHYTQAGDYLERYLSSRPGDSRAQLLAARCARRLRNYEEAHEHLRRCREAGGDSEAISVEHALIDVQKGHERQVETLRQRAQGKDELALVILEVLIQYDLDTSRLWHALQGLTQYLSRRPDDLQALLGRGFVWERFLSYRDALGDYRKAVAAHPDNEQAHLHLAETLLIVGTPGEALTQFRWLEERSPGRPEVRLGLARCRRRLGQADEARKLLDHLLAEMPDHGEALWERAQLDLDEGKADQAEPLLQRAVRLLPYDRRVHYTLYRCLLDLNRRAEAETVGARVAQLDADLQQLDRVRLEVMKRPEDAALRCQGGLLFLRNGERQQGLRWLKLALRLDPNCQAAREALIQSDALPSP